MASFFGTQCTVYLTTTILSLPLLYNVLRIMFGDMCDSAIVDAILKGHLQSKESVTLLLRYAVTGGQRFGTAFGSVTTKQNHSSQRTWCMITIKV